AEQFGPALRESVKAQTEEAFHDISSAVSEVGGKAAQEVRQSLEGLAALARDTAEHNGKAAASIGEAVNRLQEAATSLASGADLTATRWAPAEEKAGELADTLSARAAEIGLAVSASLNASRDRIDAAAGEFAQATTRAGVSVSDAARR